MQTGIIGLPQVGKTALFRILTHARLGAHAPPGQTHVGIARVPDERLEKLAAIFKPKKITHATIEYVDIGGLQREGLPGRQQGEPGRKEGLPGRRLGEPGRKEGLPGRRLGEPGRKDREKNAASLGALREADALAQVVRSFENPAVLHPSGSIDPARDIESLDIELMFNDLEQSSRRLEKVERDLKKKKDALLEAELHVLARSKQALEKEIPLRELEFKPEEQKLFAGFKFLTHKPMIYVLNLGDEEALEVDRAVEKHGLQKLAAKPHTAVVPFCGKIEAELAELEESEAAEMMRAYGLQESGRDRLIHATYRLLGVISFFTGSEAECRAWTVPRGTTALKAAGTVHSDFEKHFVKAEVVPWDHFVAAGSFHAAKERGQHKLEGKDYVVEDGDVILFRHTG